MAHPSQALRGQLAVAPLHPVFPKTQLPPLPQGLSCQGSPVNVHGKPKRGAAGRDPWELGGAPGGPEACEARTPVGPGARLSAQASDLGHRQRPSGWFQRPQPTPHSAQQMKLNVATDPSFQTQHCYKFMNCLKSRKVSSHGKLEMTLENITVVMGSRKLNDVHLERKQVQKIIIHKDYKLSHLDSDLSLLLLATPVQFTNFKMPICLQKKEKIWDRCWMTEWVTAPTYNQNDNLNVYLQKLRVVQINQRTCSQRVDQLSRNMLCARKEPGTKGNCQGDSGAPMVCTIHGNKRLFQVGVFSWAIRSGFRGRPGMFVSVARFLPWIQKETEKEEKAYTVSGAQRRSLPRVLQYPLWLGLGSQMLLTHVYW
ncbi:serine protease-like protein 51 [Hippopotamus amphibius kiboko]|uniref:serine protease-like protein 51 n=1 Tax=Hippopotamus amphibius kiboko TaxID=575201 RepID=UPI002599CC5B|nr:serine protease-like protein 51 [Hippopotamus amphibius kiboko]